MSADDEEKLEEAELFSRALNPSMQGALENLIATKCVAASINNDPLYQLRLILEAFRLLSPEQQKSIVQDEEERLRLEFDYGVLTSLLYIERRGSGNGTSYGTIPWSFGKNQAGKYLGFYRVYQPDWPEDLRKALSDDDEEAWSKVSEFWYVHFINEATFAECLMFKNQFIEYAMYKCLRILREIQKQIITRETWEDALAALSGGKRKSEAAVVSSVNPTG
ncbi:MAG: hypothetical protein JRN68_05070 [Nitrososphaerota archaeon]|nr:hypothetical protein [Nitrososphaerota archaeon]